MAIHAASAAAADAAEIAVMTSEMATMSKAMMAMKQLAKTAMVPTNLPRTQQRFRPRSPIPL